jgi:hypothetical protein
LANLVRSSSSGDGPFTYDYTITNGSHPITHGPYGTFNGGASLRAAHSDHDQAEADGGRGAVTVAELAGGRDKIVATVLPSGGIVVYWNGNHQVSDWTGVLSPAQEQTEEERKGEAQSQTTSAVTLDEVRGQAQRIAPEDLPPKANLSGSEPVWSVPAEALARLRSPASPQASQTMYFPSAGDTVNLGTYPFWWQDGDYAEGRRTLTLGSVNGLTYDWSTTLNALTGTGRVDLELRINGLIVGGFAVNPGELAKSVSFGFAPIAGPEYSIRLEETNTVDLLMGSIQIPMDLSTLTFYSPSTPEQVALLKNTLYWLVPTKQVYLPMVLKNP